MWANSVWGLFGLSASCVLTMLGLNPMSPWQSLLLAGAIVFLASSIIVLLWPLRTRANRVKIAQLASHPARTIRLIEPMHLVIFGLAIAAVGVGWHMRVKATPALVTEEGGVTMTEISVPIVQTTAGMGSPPDAKLKTIQWNQVFGTTRSVDRVFDLLLDGYGPASQSIKLKRAYLESAKTGEVIEMKVAGETPLDDAYPISEANPIPPKGFIRLVAVMNPQDIPTGPQYGLLNRDFLDRWSNIWFNATYDDGTPPHRLYFDLSGYFPEISGPHATRKIDAKK